MSYSINSELGPNNYMHVRSEGLATVQLAPLLAATEPPLSFGRLSGADAVTLPDGKRRLYTAINYAFNSPNWFQVSV